MTEKQGLTILNKCDDLKGMIKESDQAQRELEKAKKQAGKVLLKEQKFFNELSSLMKKSGLEIDALEFYKLPKIEKRKELKKHGFKKVKSKA